jgi:acyl dehydratase
MSVDKSVIGQPTGGNRVRIERGPVSYFASAVKDDNPVYRDPKAAKAAGLDDLPAPPTFSFAWTHMGKVGEEQPPDPTQGRHPMNDLMGSLMSKGGIVLHGEQEFVYHRPVVAGDVLVSSGKIADVYERESKGKTMTFVVMETVWSDEKTGEPVITETFNLIHRL